MTQNHNFFGNLPPVIHDCIGFPILMSLRDWSAPPSQPIKLKPKTNLDWYTRIFPRFMQSAYF